MICDGTKQYKSYIKWLCIICHHFDNRLFYNPETSHHQNLTEHFILKQVFFQEIGYICNRLNTRTIEKVHIMFYFKWIYFYVVCLFADKQNLQKV